MDKSILRKWEEAAEKIPNIFEGIIPCDEMTCDEIKDKFEKDVLDHSSKFVGQICNEDLYNKLNDGFLRIFREYNDLMLHHGFYGPSIDWITIKGSIKL